jgi:hypothetical protein
MKKFAIIIVISVLGAFAANAMNTLKPAPLAADQILYCKVFNNTANPFDYKVGADIYTIPVNMSSGFAFEENTQILKKDTNGNWVNWFVFGSTYSGQTVMLSDLLASN